MKKAPSILLLFDFDGTLSPIAKDPRSAVLPRSIKKWLINLARRRNFSLGIVTGRSLPDIRKKVGLENIIYAANHGMEIYADGRFLLRKGASFRKPLSQLAKELEGHLSGIEGIVIEDKGLSVAVHFRMVRKNLRNKIKRIVKGTSRPWLKKYNLQMTAGKMIMEVRPALHWNKGKAALWIWKKLAPKYMPIYIGDDATDEDAFAALKPHGLTIRIGQKKGSHAEYLAPSIKKIIDSALFDLLGLRCLTHN